MKEVADMGLDEMAKIFSHVEENSRLDSISTSINGSIKNTDPETSSNTNPDPTTFPTMVDSVLQERDPRARELIEEDVIIPTQDVKPDDITYVNKEYENKIIYMNQLDSMIMRIEDLILGYSAMIIITIYSFR
jgi:hypothetical protein